MVVNTQRKRCGRKYTEKKGRKYTQRCGRKHTHTDVVENGERKGCGRKRRERDVLIKSVWPVHVASLSTATNHLAHTTISSHYSSETPSFSTNTNTAVDN